MSDELPTCSRCGNVYCECPSDPYTPAFVSKEAESFIAFQAAALVRGLSCAEVDSFTAEIAHAGAIFEVTVTKLI